MNRECPILILVEIELKSSALCFASFNIYNRIVDKVSIFVHKIL